MTRDESIDRLIEDYLDDYEGHTPLPDAVRDAIRAELPSTQQRPAWWPRPRFFEMNNHMTRNYGIAAAALVAAGAIALNAFSGSRTGAPSATQSSSPAATASPTAESTPKQLTALDADGTAILAAGTYRIDDPFPVEFALDLPSGWALRTLEAGAAEFGAAGTNGSPYLGFFVVKDVYVDACHPERGTRHAHRGLQVAPAIEDANSLITYLRSIGGVSAGPASQVTVGGRAATHFMLTNSIDMAADRCSDDPWVYLFDPLDGEPARTVPGTAQEVWVVSETSSDWPVLVVGEVSETAASDEATISDILASVRWAGAASPNPSPSPTAASTPRQLTSADKDAVLPAGTYRIDEPFSVELALELPSGWSLRNVDSGAAEFGAAGTNGSPYLGFFKVDKVYADPCHPGKGWREATTTDELTMALSNMRGFDVGNLGHVTIGGRPATTFTITNTLDAEKRGCSDPPWLYLFDPYSDGQPKPARTVGGTTQEMSVVSVWSPTDLQDEPVLIVDEIREGDASDRILIASALASIQWANQP